MPRWAALLFSALLVSGCGEGAEDWKSQVAAIQGGELDAGDRATVGIVVHLPTQQITCSGVLIAPSVVATARHCVVAHLDGPVVCGRAPLGEAYPTASIDVTTTLTSDNSLPSEGGAHHSVGEIRVVPGGNDVCGFDLALLVLSDLVLPDEAAPSKPRFAPPPHDGEIYAAIGYGATCGDLINNERCRIESGARRRIEGLTVRCTEVCPAGDFAPTSEWLGDRGLCEGDSGGAAIDESGALIGVGLRGEVDAMGNCVGAIFARVDAWRSFLVDTVRQISANGGTEIPSWALDRADASTESDVLDSTNSTREADMGNNEDGDAKMEGDPDGGHPAAGCSSADTCTQGEGASSAFVAGGGCSVVGHEITPSAWRMAGVLLGLATAARRWASGKPRGRDGRFAPGRRRSNLGRLYRFSREAT